MAARKGRKEMVPPEDAELARLLAMARQGDVEALGALLKRLEPKLLQLARRHLGRPGKEPAGLRPSDLVQETAERAVRNFHRFAGATAHELQAWLTTILSNLLVQHHRASQRQKRAAPRTVSLSVGDAEPPAPETSPSQHLAHKRRWRRLLAAIFALPSGQREAVHHYLRGMELGEIAAQLNRSKAAVSCLLQRGTATLRAQLSGALPAASVEDTRTAALEAALQEYLERREQGLREARERVLAAHPDVAAALGELLDWLAEMQALLGHAD